MVESHHHHVPWQSLPRTALLHISRHLDGDSSSSSSPSSSSSSTTFSSTVFWTVNAIWIAVVLGLLLWCWKCGGAERLTGWIHQHNNRHDSDAHFAQVVRERQQEQQQQGQEQQLDTPQQRKQALLQSFQQHQVTMVVTAKDFVPEQVDGAPAAAAAAATLVEHDNKNDNNNNNNNTNPWDALEAGLVQHHNNYTNHNTHEEEASHKVGVAKQLKHENEVEPQRSLSSLSVAAAPPVGTTLVRQQCQDNNDRGLDQVEEEKEASNNNETSSACRDDRTDDNNNNINSIDTMDLEEGFTNNDKDRESAQDEDDDDDDDDDADDEQDWNNHLAIMNDFEMDAAESGFIVLPKQQGTVPNCCAVCLCPYEEGESLVWSSNGNCRHAFHEECIVDWLVKMKDGAPCPCCRQPFADLGEPKKKKKVISWDATRSMDPSVIRLR